jgi:hypothetical protein
MGTKQTPPELASLIGMPEFSVKIIYSDIDYLLDK